MMRPTVSLALSEYGDIRVHRFADRSPEGHHRGGPRRVRLSLHAARRSRRRTSNKMGVPTIRDSPRGLEPVLLGRKHPVTPAAPPTAIVVADGLGSSPAAVAAGVEVSRRPAKECQEMRPGTRDAILQ